MITELLRECVKATGDEKFSITFERVSDILVHAKATQIRMLWRQGSERFENARLILDMDMDRDAEATADLEVLHLEDMLNQVKRVSTE